MIAGSRASASGWIWVGLGIRIAADDVGEGAVVVDTSGRTWVCIGGPFARLVWMERVKPEGDA